jgi:hypothetical protein
MNHQPSSAANCADIQFATFKGEETTEARVIDVSTLTAADIKALLTSDPFMYYSIFKPTIANHSEAELLQHVGNEGPDAHVMVARQTRLSVECDATTVMLQMMERHGDDAAVNHDGNDEVARQLAMLLGHD